MLSRMARTSRTDKEKPPLGDAERWPMHCLRYSFLRGLLEGLRLEFEALRSRIDDDFLTVANLTRNQLAAERGLQLALDHSAQRSRAV